MSREDAYRLGAAARDGGIGMATAASPICSKPTPKSPASSIAATIDGLFDTAYHLKHVDTIFRRVFGE